MDKNDRFISTYGQEMSFGLYTELFPIGLSVIVDRATGVNYILTRSREGLAMCPCYGANGQIIVTNMAAQNNPPQKK